MKNKHLSPISSIDDLKSLAYEDGWKTLFVDSEVEKNSNLVIDIRRDENERRHAIIYQETMEEKSLHNLSDIHDISELNKKDDLHLNEELIADIKHANGEHEYENDGWIECNEWHDEQIEER